MKQPEEPPYPLWEFIGAGTLLGWSFGSIITLFTAYVAMGFTGPVPAEYAQDSDEFGWVYWSAGGGLIFATVLLILGFQKLIEYRRFKRGDTVVIQNHI